MKKEASRQSDKALFEGMTSLRAVLYAMENSVSDRKISKVWFDLSRAEKKSRELAFVKTKSKEYGFDLIPESGDFIESRALGTSHGGILFECTDRTVPHISEAKIPENGFIVMLEGIEDPYNFGYAVRSLYAAGADAIVLSPRNWMSAAGVVCRSSAGCSEMIPLFTADPEDAVSALKENGYKTVCAGIRNSVSAFDADLKKSLFLIVGGERRGISAKLLALADQIVRLDYGRAFNGSLSAASAASILGYEILRQNRSKISKD